ncbi:antibiotic biosynthesis monooxygenase [Amycolatopsis ultiminotia]|uniref:Antibiotic biosynthesis monooxygenase n=1 Tax=Amycolatopsis ultiminotia TaxID=543629 RepID=A0ABP6XAE1_9PSEU
MSGRVLVLLYHLTEDEAGIETAYHQVSAELAGVPGLLGNELLRSVHDSRAFLVLSTWRDRAAFDAWEQGSSHKASTAPLRPFRDTENPRALGVYRQIAEHGDKG